MRRRFTPLDVVVVAGLLVLNWAALGRDRGEPAAVEIVSAAGTRQVRLGAGVVRMDGPLGETVLEVAPDGVRVVSSPCPLQLCVRQGWVRRPGGVVACLPNRVAARVEGREGVDAVGR